MDTSISGLIELIVWLLLGGLAFWLALYIVGVLQLPDPFRKIVLVLVALVAILIILNRLGVLA